MGEHLKISISGVRGVIGEKDGLTPDLIVNFAQAFGTYMNGGTVVLGSDSRPTLRMVKPAVIAGLLATGCNVIDIGIVPTPTVLFMVRKLGAAAGLAITASHNPLQWNALKLIDKKGCFLGPVEADRLFKLYESKDYKLVTWDKLGTVSVMDPKKVADAYLGAVFAKVNIKKIKAARFKVAIDPVNGAGAGLTEVFLKKLGCKVSSINNIPDGIFGRKAEPLPENLGDLCRLVKRTKSDIGFAQDPDADRLACVSEKGIPLGEEYTLPMVIDLVLHKKKSPVVINTATSLAGEKVAQKYGCKVHRTRIGEINVTEKMVAVGSIIGGEGNGGVIYTPINLGRDSYAGMALILEYMAVKKMPISRLKAALPQFEIIKRTMPAKGLDVDRITAKIKAMFPDKQIDLMDGIKVLFEDAWVIVRPSNTEPIVRIIAEAKTATEASALADSIIREISK